MMNCAPRATAIVRLGATLLCSAVASESTKVRNASSAGAASLVEQDEVAIMIAASEAMR